MSNMRLNGLQMTIQVMCDDPLIKRMRITPLLFESEFSSGHNGRLCLVNPLGPTAIDTTKQCMHHIVHW